MEKQEDIGQSLNLNELESEKSRETNKTVNPFWRKKLVIILLILFAVFALIVAVLLILILSSSSTNPEDDLDKLALISCKFDIQSSTEKTKILGSDFKKKNNFNIYIDSKKISYVKEYMFSSIGEHLVQFTFYDKNFGIDYMFKGVSNLISVELISEKNAEINSMKSTFENCINLEKFTMKGFITNKMKTISKLFYNTKILNENLNI